MARIASPARAYPARSVCMKSTPAKPLTCRSTKPGAAIPRAAAGAQADRGDLPARDVHVAGDQRAVHQRGLDAEPHPFTAPAVVPLIRCLRRMMKTMITGSV